MSMSENGKTELVESKAGRKKGDRKGRLGLCVVFGLFMAVLLTAGSIYSAEEFVSPVLPDVMGKTVTMAVILIAVCWFFLFLTDRMQCAAERLSLSGERPTDDRDSRNAACRAAAARVRRLLSRPLPCFFILWVLIGLFWLPAFLAVFPGVYSYDASVQVLQFFGGEPVSSHHPLLHTLFLCGSLKLGELLFHSYQAGLAIHSILQAAIVGAVFSYCMGRMIRGRRSALLVAAAWLFLVVNPYMQILVFTTTKDVLFGAAFLLSFLFAGDFASAPLRFLENKREMLRLFAAFFFCCLLRNQGIYVFLFFSLFVCLFLLFAKKERRRMRAGLRRWLIFTACLTALYLAASGPVPAAFGVEKGDPREALSVPMQQMARVYHEEPERMSGEERDYLLRLIPAEYLNSYVRVNADPVKSGFQTEVLREDPAQFFRVWFSLGLKAPQTYIDSFCMGSWGYWYPLKSQYWIYYIYFDGAFMEAPFNVLNIHRSSLFPGYENFLRNISLTPAFDKIPVLSVILNQAFPFWVMLFTALFFLDRRKLWQLLPLALILGYWGTLLLGPVTSVRYVFPLMICVPVLLEPFFSYIDGKG